MIFKMFREICIRVVLDIQSMPIVVMGVINAGSFRGNGVILGTGGAHGCLDDVASGLTGMLCRLGLLS